MDVPPSPAPDTEGQSTERRIWPSLVVCAVLLPAAIAASTGGLLVALAIYGGFETIMVEDALLARVAEIMQEPLGLLLVVLPGQAVFLAAAVIPAIMSPVPIATRLGLRRPRIPLWSIPILMVATLAVGLVNLLTLRLLGNDAGQQIEMLSAVFRDAPPAGFACALIVLSVVPGLVEELLFRGYLLGGFLRRWPPVVAVAFTSVFFAAVHLDPQHALLVLPLGVWLGVMTWRTGSIVPAVLCHLFNNLYGMIATRFTDPEAILAANATLTTIDLVIVVTSGVAFVVSIVVLVGFRRP